MNRIYLGYDPNEHEAFEVCRHSLDRHTDAPLYIFPLRTRALRAMSMYWRPDDPLASTDFTYTRFLTPFFGGRHGWALFMDCDILCRGDVGDLFALADPRYAVMVVKHAHKPAARAKMGGKRQTVYPRKNWSSVVLWNCTHPSNLEIDWLTAANEQPASWLHQFKWLKDAEIGALPLAWNYLVGHNTKAECSEPKFVHFTEGVPGIHPGHDEDEYAAEWLRERTIMRIAA